MNGRNVVFQSRAFYAVDLMLKWAEDGKLTFLLSHVVCILVALCSSFSLEITGPSPTSFVCARRTQRPGHRVTLTEAIWRFSCILLPLSYSLCCLVHQNKFAMVSSVKERLVIHNLHKPNLAGSRVSYSVLLTSRHCYLQGLVRWSLKCSR